MQPTDRPVTPLAWRPRRNEEGAKSCLYLKRLADVDPTVLKELVSASVKHMRQTHS